jgi:hypothetical protein
MTGKDLKLDSSLNFLSFFSACVMLLNEIFPNLMDIVSKFGKSMTISIFTLTK